MNKKSVLKTSVLIAFVVATVIGFSWFVNNLGVFLPKSITFFAPEATKNLINYQPTKKERKAMEDYKKNPKGYHTVPGIEIKLPDGSVMKLYTDGIISDYEESAKSLDASEVFSKQYQNYFPEGTVIVAPNGSSFKINKGESNGDIE